MDGRLEYSPTIEGALNQTGSIGGSVNFSKGEPGEPGKEGPPGRDGQAIMPISYINPRISGGWPNYRYYYEIYTDWEWLPDGFLFNPQLVYGLQNGDGWGVQIYCAGHDDGWTATTENFDGWNIEAGTYLFSYAEGKVTCVKGVKGDPGTTPHIGDNSNWWIGDIDTGKPSRGEPGQNGEASVSIATPEQAGIVKLPPYNKWTDVNLDENSGNAATPRMVFEAYSMIERLFNAHDLNSNKHTTAEEKARWNAKSDFSGNYADLNGQPTALSNFRNDLGFITRAVADLVNYYTKSETYTKDEVKALVSAIPKFAITVVQALPTADISETTIYLVPGGEGDDLYTEYIYTNRKWEILGSQRVDLTGYATETWVLGRLEEYQPKGNYALKGEIPTSLHQLADDPLHLLVTTHEKDKWNASITIPHGVCEEDMYLYPNPMSPGLVGNLQDGTLILQTFKNGVKPSSNMGRSLKIGDQYIIFRDKGEEALAPGTYLLKYNLSASAFDVVGRIREDAIGTAELQEAIDDVLEQAQGFADDVKVPTKLSELSGDADHRTVTDNERTAWNKKLDEGDADPAGTAESKVSAHNVDEDAHNDIRLLIEGLTNRLNAIANSTDEDLDQMAELVAYIKANKALIDSITTSKVSVTDIVNNLTTNVANKPLSAAQGVALKALIDAITVPTKLSELAGDTTHRTVTDAEKSAWNAKSNFSGNYNDLSNKPTIPTVPVQSVNGKTGEVQLGASDVGARPSTWTPSAADVGAVPTTRKVNGKALSADISLSASDVGAVPTTATITVTGVDEDGVTHTWKMYGVKQ